MRTLKSTRFGRTDKHKKLGLVITTGLVALAFIFCVASYFLYVEKHRLMPHAPFSFGHRHSLDNLAYHERVMACTAIKDIPGSVNNGIHIAKLLSHLEIAGALACIRDGGIFGEYGGPWSFEHMTFRRVSIAVIKNTKNPGVRLSFKGSRFIDSHIIKSDLQNANFEATFFHKSHIVDTRWNDANFENAAFSESRIDLVSGSIPEKGSLASIALFEKNKYNNNPQFFLLLKDAYKSGGFIQEERLVTSIIERAKTRTTTGPDRLFRTVFLGFPFDYGNHPGRPLLIIVLLIPVFAVAYLVSVVQWSERSGIWVCWDPNRIELYRGPDQPSRLVRLGLPAIGWASYFSLLSAFHIGWRDLNVGTWISRVQPREFTLRATGWVKTVCGIQSIITVYLLALWAISYFGRPFG